MENRITPKNYPKKEIAVETISDINAIPDGKLEDFTELLINEINGDDEPYMDKGRAIIEAARDGDVDGIFLGLCGWSLSTLLGKALK